MNLIELREQLIINLTNYMDTVQPQFLEIDKQWVIDDMCMTIMDTFDEAFFAPAPISLDTTP